MNNASIFIFINVNLFHGILSNNDLMYRGKITDPLNLILNDLKLRIREIKHQGTMYILFSVTLKRNMSVGQMAETERENM